MWMCNIAEGMANSKIILLTMWKLNCEGKLCQTGSDTGSLKRIVAQFWRVSKLKLYLQEQRQQLDQFYRLARSIGPWS